MADEIVIQVRLDNDEIPRDIERIRRQIEAGLAPDRRHSATEAKERVHHRRIEAIHQQSAAALQQIEARKQAQIDVIRERAVQREIEQQRRLERAVQSGSGSFQAFLRRFSSTIREAGESIQQAGFAALGITAAVVNLGRASVRAAVDIDRQVNVLKSLSGSAAEAERRFAQLVATAQRTPGLTTNLAATLDAQLRVLSVTERTIDRVLPAIGRLNAVSPIADPNKFVGNLVQLVTQNFERQDLKELVGQSPLAGELIRQIFDVDSPTNAKAIRVAAQRLGIRTVEDFFTQFAAAAANNPKLQAVTESLGAQFEKLRDRILVALRPLGLALIEALKPLVERAVPIIERISKAFAELPEGVRQLIIILGGLAAAFGPVLIAIGALIQTFGAFGNLITALVGAGGISALTAALGPLIPVVLAVVNAVGLLVAAFVTDFGGIRTVVFDVLGFIQTQFGFVKQAFIDNRAEIEKFKILFGVFSEEVKPILKALGEAFKNAFELAIKGAIVVARSALQFFNQQLALTIGSFRLIKSLLEQIARAGAAAADFLTPGIGIGSIARDRFRSLTQSRASSLIGSTSDVDEERADALRFLQEQSQKLAELDPNRKRSKGGDAAGESSARALAAARLSATQSALENEFKLLKDSNERILRENQHFFEIGLIQADQFFRDKLGLQQASIGNEINLLNQQLIAAQDAFNKTKPNTAERLRIQEQLNDLQTQIVLKTRELGDVEREVSRESLAARNQAVEAQKQQLELADQQSKKEQEILRAVQERAKTQEAIIRAAREPLKDRGKDLDRAILETGANLDLKILNAQKEAILENKRADEEAILSMVKNRERLADATIFHAERANAIFLDHLARQQSVTEAVAEAQIKAFEGVAGSLDRGIDKLTKKLGVFGDVINGIIKSIVRNLLANLFAPTFGGGFGGQQAGGGILGSILGAVFGPTGGGLAGGVFRTPSTFPNAFNIGSLLGFAGGGSNLVAPPSLTFDPGGGLPTLPRPNPGFSQAIQNAVFGGGQTGFGALGKTLGPLAPLLGLSLGVGIGGQSRAGQILGGIGGTLGGLVAGTALAGGTLGGLGSTFALSGALGPAALIAAPLLLLGGFFLGRAKQRRQDEEAAGQFLGQAFQAVEQLAAGIASDQIDGSSARSILESQIVGPFIQQINSLKTASVRRDWVRNQVPEIRARFEANVVPLIAAQEERRRLAQRSAAIDSRLIPQFAVGGVVPGLDRGFDSVRALLRPGEMVLTQAQQSAIALRGGPDIFRSAGVPGVQPQATFQTGGIAPAGGGRSDAPIVIFLDAVVDAERIFIRGGSSESGRQVIVKQIDETNLGKGRR